jgi:hypothetical protein
MLKLVAVALLLALPRPGIDRRELEKRYDHKYLVVQREGIAVGVCATEPQAVYQGVRIDGDQVKLEDRYNFFCNVVTPEPIHTGEVVKVIDHPLIYSGALELKVQSVSPHAVTRGIAANEHESPEVGKAEIHFKLPVKKDYDGLGAIIDRWLKAFDTLDEAAAFAKRMGNTASGAFVKEVKLGMTPAEVEAVMGLPASKADLGEKVLYKYKDMTVEFHDGKVTDVR